MSSALEKARESADAANIRACYAEVMTIALTEDTNKPAKNGAFEITQAYTKDGQVIGKVTLTQKIDNWQNTAIHDIAGILVEGSSFAAVKGNEYVTVTYDDATGEVTIAAAAS